MPLKELLLVAMVVVIGHGAAWAFHNVGLSVVDRNLIRLVEERRAMHATQMEWEDSLFR